MAALAIPEQFIAAMPIGEHHPLDWSPQPRYCPLLAANPPVLSACFPEVRDVRGDVCDTRHFVLLFLHLFPSRAQ